MKQNARDVIVANLKRVLPTVAARIRNDALEEAAAWCEKSCRDDYLDAARNIRALKTKEPKE